jgi:ABC-type nitrate/sulfonate/bicarbonate transport system permease component
MTEHEIIVKHLRRVSIEAYVVGAVAGSVLGIGLAILIGLRLG